MKITKQKMITLCYVLLASIMLLGQTPSNDCGENYLEINECGLDFSVTQAQMSAATNDEFCDVGGSCPITYVNGTGYENLDCNTGTGINSSGDDFNGSIENSLWWGFVPSESCTFTVNIDITNCCCKDKGSSNSAQYQIFHADSPLPGGTILGNYAYQTGVTGSFTETFTVTAGETVYILLDGLNGTDCDIDVSIMPGSDCTGCSLSMAESIKDFDINYKDDEVIITWTSEDANGVSVQRSNDGKTWSNLNKEIINTSEFSFKVIDTSPYDGYNYYKINIDDEPATRTKVILHVKSNKGSIIKTFDLTGKEITDIINYKGLLINLYENGSVIKTFK